MLRTPLASNALDECKKMKSVVKLATEVLLTVSSLSQGLTMLSKLLGEDIVGIVP